MFSFEKKLNIKPQLAAYVYPAWHPSSCRDVLGKTWSEWECIRSAKPMFSGHRIVESPLWGYYDDTNPIFVQKQINTALKYNIEIFVFNYYWNQKPIMNEGVDDGFLKAENNKKIQFALILSPRLPRVNLPLPKYLKDDVDRKQRGISWDANNLLGFIKFCIKNYFWRNNYIKFNNKPILYFFQYYKYIESFGGYRAMKHILSKTDILLKENGFEGLYSIGTSDYLCFVKDLFSSGFSALTSYNLMGNYQEGKPVQDYPILAKKRAGDWNLFLEKGGSTYFPSVSLGFDASCRGEHKIPTPERLDGGRFYPWYPIVTNFNMASYKLLLSQAFDFLRDKKIHPPIIHLSSWNEWSEGSHLEPGRNSGYIYLQAVKEIYKKKVLYQG